MTLNITVARTAWSELKAAQWLNLPRQIQIGEMPSFPLASAVDLPESFDFPRGSLAARLTNLSINIDGDVAPEIVNVSQHGGRAQVCLRFRECTINGSHTLETKQIWETNLDGAGTGLAFDENGRVRHPGGAEANKNPTWIATANEQRAKLNEMGGNGTTLLDTYTTHRAAFTDVLTSDAGYPFQVGWATPSITAMAEHTNNCMTQTSQPINSDSTYENGNTYNQNSALQQLAMLTTLAGMPGATTPDGNPVEDSPYQKAAAATASFNGSVLTNTNAQKTQEIPPQTSDNVYELVRTGTPALEVSVAQVHQLLSGENIGGRCADGSTWSMVLNDKERRFVRDLQARQQQHLERVAAAKPVVIACGSTFASLSEFHLLIEFEIDSEQHVFLHEGRVELDSFALELDDSQWPDYIKAIAYEELSRTHFIKSLVHDRVADALERELVDIVLDVLTDALQ